MHEKTWICVYAYMRKIWQNVKNCKSVIDVVVQPGKPLLGITPSHIRVPGSNLSCYMSYYSFLLMHLGNSRLWQNKLVSVNYMGLLDEVPGSWLFPDPTLAAVNIWRVSQQVKGSLTVFQMNKK